MSESFENTAVITGPTGAVGIALTELLLQRGFRVYAVVRPGSLRIRKVPESAVVVPCDLSELSRLPELIPEKVRYFFHLGWTGTTGADRNDKMLQEKNTAYTLEACIAAKELASESFVFAGSQAEYGQQNVPLTPGLPCHPENAYGKEKLNAGKKAAALCESLGIRFVHARILSVYGPHDGEKALLPTLIRGLLNGVCPPLTEGRQIWDYLYEADAAKALYRLALSGKNGGIYPVGSGVGRPLKDYITVTRDLSAPDVPLDFGAVPYNERSVMFLKADISALTEDTGFRPAVSFEEGIIKTIEAIRKKDRA